MSITVQDIVREVAAQTGYTQVDTRDILSRALEVIAVGLANGDSIVLTGIGRIQTRIKPARQARNPNNGEPVSVPSKRVLKITPRGDLKAQLLVVPEEAAPIPEAA